jgi:hypothetical protein
MRLPREQVRGWSSYVRRLKASRNQILSSIKDSPHGVKNGQRPCKKQNREQYVCRGGYTKAAID